MSQEVGDNSCWIITGFFLVLLLLCLLLMYYSRTSRKSDSHEARAENEANQLDSPRMSEIFMISYGDDVIRASLTPPRYSIINLSPTTPIRTIYDEEPPPYSSTIT